MAGMCILLVFVFVAFYFSPVGAHSIAVSTSVCLSVCLFAYLSQKSKCPNFTSLSLRVTFGRGSVLLRRQYNELVH